LDADTKLIPSYVVGKRDSYHAKAVMADLASRIKSRPQVSSDALASYSDAIDQGFGSEVDYGQVVKTFSFTNLINGAAGKYSPAEVISTERKTIFGMPDVSRICTSHVYHWIFYALLLEKLPSLLVFYQ
jgi:transposase-like protein